MTEWWFYVAGFFAAATLVNGVPHFTNGISGRPFPTIFTRGIRDDTPVNNVLWGSANWVVGGILLWLIRDGLSNVVLVTEMVVVGVAGAVSLARRFSRSR